MSNTEAIWRILAGRASNCITRPNTVPPKRPVWTGTKTENAPKGPNNKITKSDHEKWLRGSRMNQTIATSKMQRQHELCCCLTAHLRPVPHNRLTGTIQRICRNVIARQNEMKTHQYEDKNQILQHCTPLHLLHWFLQNWWKHKNVSRVNLFDQSWPTIFKPVNSWQNIFWLVVWLHSQYPLIISVATGSLHFIQWFVTPWKCTKTWAKAEGKS